MDEKASFYKSSTSFEIPVAEGKKVQLEGFLHKTDEGVWLLCDAPDLKSCCLKKHALAALEGDFSRYAPDAAVTVKGVYSAGILIDAAVQEKNGSFPYWTLGAVLLAVSLWMAIKWLKGRPLLP